MAILNCKLLCHSNFSHLQQLYTGFSILQKNKILTLNQEVINENERDDLYEGAHNIGLLKVIVNDKYIVLYDMSDGGGIQAGNLENVDFYFKRSYSFTYAKSFGENGKKIFPLGLNYLVVPDFRDFTGFKRCCSFGKYRQALKAIKLYPGYLPRQNLLQAKPNFIEIPKVLFMVAAYDAHDDPNRSDDKIQERYDVNNVRANCIQLLKNEFGSQFYGGFIHSPYASEVYPNEVMRDNSLSSKARYLELLKQYSICIATTGLHRSIGWKFAEYVTFSKAIISEALHFEVPGSLEEGLNYLAFKTPEDCVERAVELYENQSMRNRMMERNYDYSQAYVQPQSMVLTSLNTVLENI